MTRFIKTLIFFFFTLAIFSSCKKTNAPTDGQLVAAKLKAVLGDPIGKQVYIYSVNTGQQIYAGPIAELGSDGQLTLKAAADGSRIFNLGTLVYYTVSNTGVLFLYF